MERACGGVEVGDELTLVLVLTDGSALLLGVDIEHGVDVVTLVELALHARAGAGHRRAMGIREQQHQRGEESTNGE